MIRLYIIMAASEKELEKQLEAMTPCGWQVQQKYCMKTIHQTTYAWQLVNIRMPGEELK